MIKNAIELISVTTKYMHFRSNWKLWEMKKDHSRSACHDFVIFKFNQLARFLKMQGKPAKWRDVLGYEGKELNARKRIGDFICYLAFVESLMSR